MTHPENPPQDDEDGGTFKLKPGGQSQSEPPRQSESPENLDSTMKLRKADVSSAPPPPPPSPLGNPTGPANPPSPFAETSVMPQSGGSQTGFQPSTQPPGQPNPLGQPAPAPQQGQQPYGQQPPPGQYPPQQGGQPYGQQPAAAPGEAPEGVKRIGLIALIGAGMGLLGSIVSLVMLGGLAMFSAPITIVFALAFGWYGYALPRGQITSNGLRLTGIILMMIGAGFSLLGVLGGLSSMTLIGAAAAMPLVVNLLSAGVYGYASFIYIKDEQVKAYIKGAPKPQHMPPPGYGAQPGGPGGYPPPPGQPQQGQQPPYGR